MKIPFLTSIATGENAMALTPALTKTTLEQIFVQVDADPLAGRGHLTKREILIDRILAQIAISPAPSAKDVRPIIADGKAA